MFKYPVNFLKLTACLASLTLILSCGKPEEPPSNLPLSNEESQNELTKRLEKTNEIKGQINQVRDAIKPAAVLLTDLSDSVKKEETEDGKPSAELQNVLEVIQKILKEATESIVQYLPDGSWIIEKPLRLPDMAKEYVCPTAKIRLQGKREGKNETLKLFAIGCVETMKPIELASISIDDKRQIHCDFHLQKVSELFRAEHVIGDNCTVLIQTNASELNCRPIIINAKDMNIFINPLYFLKTEAGITSKILVVARKKLTQKLVLKASLDANPGQKTKIDITSKEE